MAPYSAKPTSGQITRIIGSELSQAGKPISAGQGIDALVSIAIDITRSLIFGKLDLLDMSGVVLGSMIGLASLPGSWVASLLVKRMGHKTHIAVIEALIALGGASILYHGVHAL
ncbi:hypothetical protein [Sulfuritalea sp.]|uniref:hypothetical protein n=1 Tax=Sulfuritalea sp. TaxID=2480090 RepID=UPI001AC57C6A|nr:hypothetical protein [Sulfuritalea sp.]MBN8475035.1 hypothetical protein [Sulfuritalea sp.]